MLTIGADLSLERRTTTNGSNVTSTKTIIGFANATIAVKSGEPEVKAPVYSHVRYDIIPDAHITVRRPDVVIVEGLNVLQPPPSRNDVAVSDVQTDTDTIADDVLQDPEASMAADLDAIDAQSSANDAATDQMLADGDTAQADWEADQAQSWADWAEGDAEEGLTDSAESALDIAGDYADSADADYDAAAVDETNVASDLADTSSSLGDLSTDSADYSADTTDYSADTTSYESDV